MSVAVRIWAGLTPDTHSPLATTTIRSTWGFSVLRVLNDDTIKSGGGFDPHSHRDMEIITYVTEGALEHRDSMENHFIVSAGEVQHMSAGSGITHSEFNPSKAEVLRLLQIWIQPDRQGG